MSKLRRKRRVRWGRVLLIIIFPMIIIGGIVMYCNYRFDENASKDSNEKVEEKDNNRNEDNEEENKGEGNKEGDSENTNDDDFKLESAPVNSQEYKTLSDGEYLTDKGYTLKIENGITYIDGHLIVNKTYSLPSSFKPTNTYQEVTSGWCLNCIERHVMEAFKLMQSDAGSLGLNIYISSGYRSYSYQEGLYNSYSAVDGMEKADTYSARPGHSEHQTGLCFDLNEINDSFAKTDEGKWVDENAYLYGFIIRYPKGKSNITGYKYESWHLRYVGKDLASKLYNNGDWITMEEYYGLSSSY